MKDVCLFRQKNEYVLSNAVSSHCDENVHAYFLH